MVITINIFASLDMEGGLNWDELLKGAYISNAEEGRCVLMTETLDVCYQKKDVVFQDLGRIPSLSRVSYEIAYQSNLCSDLELLDILRSGPNRWGVGLNAGGSSGLSED